MGTEIQPVPLYIPEANLAGEEPAQDFDLLKGRFLASLNHELRTPLSGVIGMTDLLAETALAEEQREYLDTIRECAGQLLESLNALLDFSALSAGQGESLETEFDLRSVLDSVAGDAASRARLKGLKLFTNWHDSLPESILGDERYLKQSLHHLLRNAVKFTSRGEIVISALVEASSQNGRRLLIHVADSGIGIPPEKLGLIFQSFRQLDSGLARSYSGLGLGLALSEKMVRAMGGEISAASEPGRGTTFTISLPLTTPMSAVRAGEQLSGRRPLILVVEDNKTAQRVIEHVLDRADCDVIVADNGESGLRMAASRPVDLILMDLQMPGMDGFAASRAIRALPGGTAIPIIALTANYSDEHRALCQQIGMQGFLSKPIQREELLGALKSHLTWAN